MHRHILPLPKRLAGVTRSTTVPSVAPTVSSISPPTPAPAPDAADARALKGLLDSLGAIIDKARKQRHGTVAELAQQSVELGVAIAERLLGAALMLNRQRLDQIVLSSLARIPTNSTVTVRCHPDDVKVLQQQIETHGSLEQWRETLTFQRDETCARGRLILETGDLFVDWDSRRGLAEIRNILIDEIFIEA